MMNRTLTGIDVLSCVQGNTVRKADVMTVHSSGCVVYDFHRKGSSAASSNGTKTRTAANRSRKAQQRRKRAARAAELRRKAIRAAVLAALLVLVLGIGGIASRAQSRKVPEAYKYYDTITVAYQENLLDIVLRYDDRDHYKTQFDYVEELCRINNIAFDGTSYPEVAPGTHLVVPYYSTVLK